ncbi:MAG: ABC transporter substrate-binding protein [Phycisphaerae bacterium]
MRQRFWDLVDEFPPGRVPLLLLVMAMASGTAVVVRSVIPEPTELTVWTFTHIANEEFKQRLADHPDGQQVKVLNLGNAMFDRLSLAIMTQTELPDLVEIEQSHVGRYLRGPVEQIPFVDLTERLEQQGWDEKVVRARFARYSVGERIFGIPHDVHPMVLVYRPDVLASLGYSPEDLSTWDKFSAAARSFYRAGELGSTEWRAGLALSTVEGHDFLALLWQRGGDVFDAAGNVILDSSLAVSTLEFYVSLFHWDPPVAGAKLSNWTEDFAALSRGQFLAYAAPDWMLATMQLDARSLLEGNVRCMPLPAWEPSGRRTSTGGGTAMFIPKGCPDVDRAWELAKLLYFDHESLVKRFRIQSIVPPLRTVFDDPVFNEQTPFFQGQRIGRLLTELAEEVPPINGSPYAPDAYTLLNAVFADVVEGRVSPPQALSEVARELREIIARDQRAVEAAGSN